MSSLTVQAVTPLLRRTASILSPLRYPGGKRRLVGYIAEVLRLNELRPKLFVEPFAGGASVAIQLLNDGLVERIGLGEKDPLVAAFWRTVFRDHEWLVKQVHEWEPSLPEWERLRASQPRYRRDKALKCLFLNRTSFSGIMSDTAGPIGGRAQSSDYDIGCRFPKDRIVRRIEQAAALADRVAFVHQGDWRRTVARADKERLRAGEVFYYLDPPFYRKADRLYRYYFSEADHVALRDAIAELASPYLLSYDAAPEIETLYLGWNGGLDRVGLLYSATKSDDLQQADEIVVTSVGQLPVATRLWRTQGEWRGDGSAVNMPYVLPF
jgi:DNA adenine methylase